MLVVAIAHILCFPTYLDFMFLGGWKRIQRNFGILWAQPSRAESGCVGSHSGNFAGVTNHTSDSKYFQLHSL